MIEEGFQLAAQPQMSKAKCDNIRMPWRVWVTSGWNCTPKNCFSSFAIAANGQVSVLATATNPSGMADTLSPWLIHTSSKGLPSLLTASSMPLNSNESVSISI